MRMRVGSYAEFEFATSTLGELRDALAEMVELPDTHEVRLQTPSILGPVRTPLTTMVVRPAEQEVSE